MLHHMVVRKMMLEISCMLLFASPSRMCAFGGRIKNYMSLHLQSVLWYNIVHGPASAQDVCIYIKHSEKKPTVSTDPPGKKEEKYKRSCISDSWIDVFLYLKAPWVTEYIDPW